MLPTRGQFIATLKSFSPTVASTVKALLKYPTSVWGSYCSSLELRPFTTKTATAVFGCFMGDLLAQSMAHSTAKKSAGPGVDVSFSYKWDHALRLMLYTSITTPLIVTWYSFLDTLVYPDNPTAPMAVVTKTLCDQLGVAPVMTLVYFSAMKIMEDVASRQFPERFGAKMLFSRAFNSARAKFLPTMLACYMIWPLAHVVNFALVPSNFRILYINAVSVLWMAILSARASSAAQDPTSISGTTPPTASNFSDMGPESVSTTFVGMDVVYDPVTMSIVSDIDNRLLIEELEALEALDREALRGDGGGGAAVAPVRNDDGGANDGRGRS